jgi:signal transduction histidine kinase
VQRVARGLRPPELDEAGLLAAIRAHAHALRAETGLVVELEADAVEDLLDQDRRLVLYRVVQEALANASRHSGAAVARVRVRREAAFVVVTIEDDGRGFPEGRRSTTPGGGLGLIGIKERAAAADGHVRIDSAEGRGTRVTVTLPAAPNAEPPAREAVSDGPGDGAAGRGSPSRWHGPQRASDATPG